MKKVIVSLFSLVLVLAGASVTNAAVSVTGRVINSATFNGGLNLTVSQGATVSVSVNVSTGPNTVTTDNDWQSTAYLISTSNNVILTPTSSFTCVNTPDHTVGAFTGSESFNMTAPSTPGTYYVHFRAYRDDGCSPDGTPGSASGRSTTFTTSNTITVSNPETPVINILGSNPAQIGQGGIYGDGGAEVTGVTCEGPCVVTTTGLPINTSVTGTYTVTYTYGAVSASRTVVVFGSRRRRAQAPYVPAPETLVTTTSSEENNNSGSEEVLGASTSTDNGLASTTTAPVAEVLGAEKFVFNTNMRLGSKISPDVMELQKRLIAEGFLALDLATGYYGKATKAAVIAYQEAHKTDILSPLNLELGTGFCGPYTRAMLNK